MSREITLSGHLVFDCRGLIRVTKSSRKPIIRRGERAVALTLAVPASVFQEAIPEVALTLREPQVMAPRIEVLGPPEESR